MEIRAVGVPGLGASASAPLMMKSVQKETHDMVMECLKQFRDTTWQSGSWLQEANRVFHKSRRERDFGRQAKMMRRTYPGRVDFHGVNFLVMCVWRLDALCAPLMMMFKRQIVDCDTTDCVRSTGLMDHVFTFAKRDATVGTCTACGCTVEANKVVPQRRVSTTARRHRWKSWHSDQCPSPPRQTCFRLK